jgi:hypothetical protein
LIIFFIVHAIRVSLSSPFGLGSDSITLIEIAILVLLQVKQLRARRGKGKSSRMSKKTSSGPAAALHKVIMVGSGGVGKSAVSEN